LTKLENIAYYNEIDPYAAAWLRNLIAAGHLPAGDVDERSIVDVRPGNLEGYAQCHFFAGIGGWPYALRLAGWSDDEPVWTGSCPCQPLSGAGQRKGHADERHLWPAFHRLVAECRPATVFGEQVASKDGREWLAGVRADLEAVGYAIGGADLCAAGVGAPHIRQRLFWVAQSQSVPSHCDFGGGAPRGQAQVAEQQPRLDGATGGLAHSVRVGRPAWPGDECGRESGPAFADDGSAPGGLGDAEVARLEIGTRLAEVDGSPAWQRSEQASLRMDPWSDAVWLPCLDGRARRIEPGIQPLASGLPAAVDGSGTISRIGALRGAGNAIVPQTAAEFVKAFLEC
jgi:DNA (cytosine-5)-methyltransferase 1